MKNLSGDFIPNLDFWNWGKQKHSRREDRPLFLDVSFSVAFKFSLTVREVHALDMKCLSM